MKNRIFIPGTIILIIIVLLGLFTGCSIFGDPDPPGGPCIEPTEPNYHYIRFTLDGLAMDAEDVILNFGGYDDPTLVWWPNLGWTEMDGFNCGGGQTAAFPQFRLWARLSPYTPGVFEGVYGGPGPSIGGVSISLTITEGGIEYQYGATSSTLTITTFGDVGGDVVGTFDATLESTDPAPSLGSPSFGSSLTATIGEFRVLRGADDLYTP